jgi:hypothetical protein
MGLKAFHLVFITASILLAFGFAAWEIRAYSSTHAKLDLVMGLGSGLVGLVLLVYGKYFLKKLRHISYL